MMSAETTTRRPPEGVALIARTHWLTSGVILFCVGLLHVILRSSSVFTLTSNTYIYGGGLSFLYAATGFMVWTGTPPGRFFSYACSLLYLARPPLGLQIWRIMRSSEYKAHFERPPQDSRPG
ncbi:MAG: hypothetical protein HY736_03085 [Verrucomicrobia bacterium]|nr:hypothetical protein [Verrucomicrobiota bacterium]